ncbi:MAG: hypothetical protein ACRDLL_08880 [Solirubrobacterales bacterium]
MPFHVELSSSMSHARVFNLSHEELQATVIEPWLANRPFELAESKWTPSESSLKILEGRHLDNPDLAFGQGWSNAERTAENVTRHVLEAAPTPRMPDAFVVETEMPEAAVGEMVADRDARPVSWAEAAKRIDGRDSSVAAVILVVRREP